MVTTKKDKRRVVIFHVLISFWPCVFLALDGLPGYYAVSDFMKLFVRRKDGENF